MRASRRNCCFGRIVDEIVSQPHPAQLFGGRDALVLAFAARAEQGGVNDDIKPFEAGNGKLLALYAERLRQELCG